MSIKPTIPSCMAILAVFAAPLQAACCLSMSPVPDQNHAAHACCDSHQQKTAAPSFTPDMQATASPMHCDTCKMGPRPQHHHSHDGSRIAPEPPTEPVACFASTMFMTHQLEWSNQVYYSNALSISVPATATLVALNCQFRN